MVSNDDVSARALDGREYLQHDARPVQPAVARGRVDHRILAADVVRGERDIEALARPGEHVQIRERRFHHHDVRAFSDVRLDLPQRLADVWRVHLIAAAVAELRR